MSKNYSVLNRLAAVLVAVLMLIAAETPVAAGNMQFTVKPGISLFSGYTKFVMDLRVQWPNDAIGSIKSELDFPLDVTMAGAQVGLGSSPQMNYDWSVMIGYYTNTNDPNDLMIDGDWAYDPTPGSVNGQFSYTESHVAMDATLLTFEARRSLYFREKWVLGVTAEFRYQKFQQDVLDFTGWYIDGNGQEFTQSYDSLCLIYEVIYKIPAAGFYLTVKPTNGFSFTTRLLGAVVSAKDEDDHILRYRLATASGTGSGIIGGFGARFDIGKGEQRLRPFIEADGEYLSLTVKTSGDQVWYGDDPVTPEDDTGDELHSIPHNFYSRQYQIRLRAGLSF